MEFRIILVTLPENNFAAAFGGGGGGGRKRERECVCVYS